MNLNYSVPGLKASDCSDEARVLTFSRLQAAAHPMILTHSLTPTDSSAVEGRGWGNDSYREHNHDKSYYLFPVLRSNK